MLRNLRLHKTLWSMTAVLAIAAAVGGLVDNSIYVGRMPEGFVAAQFAQDWLTIGVGLFLLGLAWRAKKESVKEPIIALGILGSLAYLYGIFSIERVYNMYYLLYLAILSMSCFSSLYLLTSLQESVVAEIDVSRSVRAVTAGFSLLVAALFMSLWVSALVPLMRSGEQIDNLFSIYLLDLAFVMPAFVVSAVMSVRKNPYGYIFVPAMFILGIFVIAPLGLGELAKPRFGLEVDVKSMVMSFTLSGLFIAFALLQLLRLKKTDNR